MSAIEGHEFKSANAVEQIETLAGTVLVGSVTLGITFFCIILCVAPFYPGIVLFSSPLVVKVMAGAALLVLVAEYVSASFIVRLLQRHEKSALLKLWERQFTFPFILRPLVVLWWIAHFVVICLGTRWLFPQLTLPFSSGTTYETLVIAILKLLSFVGVSFSSNAYLMLASGAASRSKSFANFVYRSRFTIDLLLALAFAFVPPLGHPR